MTCSFCGGVAHPATGCVYGSQTIACYRCTIEFWSWLRKRMAGKPRGGKGPSFYDHAAQNEQNPGTSP